MKTRRIRSKRLDNGVLCPIVSELIIPSLEGKNKVYLNKGVRGEVDRSMGFNK